MFLSIVFELSPGGESQKHVSSTCQVSLAICVTCSEASRLQRVCVCAARPGPPQTAHMISQTSVPSEMLQKLEESLRATNSNEWTKDWVNHPKSRHPCWASVRGLRWGGRGVRPSLATPSATSQELVPTLRVWYQGFTVRLPFGPQVRHASDRMWPFHSKGYGDVCGLHRIELVAPPARGLLRH